MQEILQTNDPVRLSWAQSVLAEHGIECAVLDAHSSTAFGGIDQITQRLMVEDEAHDRAERLLKEAEQNL